MMPVARLGLLPACVIALAAAGPSADRPDSGFQIRADKASCLLRNSARYRAIEHYPFYLFVDLCPTVRPTPEEISRLNFAVYIKERSESGAPVRGVLRLSKKELACLLNQIRKKQSSRGTNEYLLIRLTEC